LAIGIFILHYSNLKWRIYMTMKHKIFLLFVIFSLFPITAFSADWSAMSSGTTNNLNGLWGSSGSDVFAVGDNGTILHYDGTAWSAMTSLTTNNLNAIWGISANFAFAVGAHGTILQYDGLNWLTVPSTTTNNLNAVWGLTTTYALAGGDDGTFLYYNGSWYSPMPPGTIKNRINAIWGSSSTNIFSVGDGGMIGHFGGIPGGFMDSGTTENLNGVWGSSGSSVFAVGNNGTFLIYNGSSWSTIMSGIYTFNINAIWGSSYNNIFIAGDGGIIGHFTGPPGGLMDTGTTENLKDIWGSSGYDVFAVGSNGTILHYHPAYCSAVNPQYVYKGQTLDVTITGLNTNFTDTDSIVSFGCTGITVNSTTVTSATQITASITIAPDAPPETCDVTVTTGEEIVTCANAFAVQGSISGTVTDSATGEALSGIEVAVYDATTGSYVSSVYTGIDGTYRMGGLQSGSYKVQFYDYSNIYLSEWYDNKTDFCSADDVAVTAPSNTTVNAALDRNGGSITVKVTDAETGVALSGIAIGVFDTITGYYVSYCYTDVNGTCTAGGLQSGSYKIQFYTYNGIYLSEWYDNKSDIGSADLVWLTAPSNTTVNATLDRGGSITGRVTDAETGEALSGIYVDIYDAATYSTVSYGYTGTDGTYNVGGLRSGSYKVQFRADNGIYATEWYDNKEDFESADSVLLTAPNNATVNAALGHGGSITGRVTDAKTGEALSGIYVDIYDANTYYSTVSYGVTGNDGTYTAGGLQNGSYKVQFYDNSGMYFSEWYDNKSDIGSAELVWLTAPSTTVNAALDHSGSITGTVTDAETGEALSYVGVTIFDAATGSSVAYGYTGLDGTYSAGGLRSGSYKVYFYDYNRIHLSEWYDNKSDIGSADLVWLTAPSNMTVNAALGHGGSITGRVTGANGSGISGSIGVYDTDNQQIASGYTDEGGYYTVRGLSNGNYKVAFYGRCGEAWYKNKSNFNDADIVLVTAPNTTTGIDIIYVPTTPPTTTTTIISSSTTTVQGTVIQLSYFAATPKAHKIILQWNTEEEISNAGFNIYRSDAENGNYSKINTSLIPAKGSTTQGSSYEFVDQDVQLWKTYRYKLEDIDLNGTSTMHGPVSAMPRLIYGMGK